MKKLNQWVLNHPPKEVEEDSEPETKPPSK